MPVPPSYADPEQRAFFVQWLNQSLVASGVSKTKVAAALGHDTTQQLNKFLRGEALPMPTTLRVVCREIGVPWTEGYANAGYYSEILHILAQLARFAQEWVMEDRATPDLPSSHGVRRIGEVPVMEALREDRYRLRYTIGCWEDGPFEPPPESDYEGIDPEHAALLKRANEFESKNPRRVCAVVPKPLAVAILIAVAGFPRRGDIYKDDAVSYSVHLFSNTVSLIEVAEEFSEAPLPPLLQRASDVLKDRELPFGLRRVIAAEYTVKWADTQCSMYTHIARLSALQYFGVAGASVKNLTPEIQLPQIRRATLPDLSEFSDLKQVLLAHQ